MFESSLISPSEVCTLWTDCCLAVLYQQHIYNYYTTWQNRHTDRIDWIRVLLSSTDLHLAPINIKQTYRQNWLGSCASVKYRSISSPNQYKTDRINWVRLFVDFKICLCLQFCRSIRIGPVSLWKAIKCGWYFIAFSFCQHKK